MLELLMRNYLQLEVTREIGKYIDKYNGTSEKVDDK